MEREREKERKNKGDIRGEDLKEQLSRMKLWNYLFDIVIILDEFIYLIIIAIRQNYSSV